MKENRGRRWRRKRWFQPRHVLDKDLPASTSALKQKQQKTHRVRDESQSQAEEHRGRLGVTESDTENESQSHRVRLKSTEADSETQSQTQNESGTVAESG